MKKVILAYSGGLDTVQFTEIGNYARALQGRNNISQAVRPVK